MIDTLNDFLIIPPFHDAHVHFMIDGHQASLDDCRSMTRTWLANGIVTLADMGHKNRIGLEFKKLLQEESSLPLQVQSAGFALLKKGSYGGFLGKGIYEKEEIKSAIKSLKEAGADFIKIINSGMVSFQDETPVTKGGFSMDEWKVIQEEAGRYGLPISCHANSDGAIRQAVDFGAASIEHGFFISKETLHVMIEKNVAWIPTAFALVSRQPYLLEDEKAYLDKIMENHLNAIHYAASIGVNLQVGTDSGSRGVRPGESFFKELQLFKKAGLSLDQILSAACLDHEEIARGNYLLVEKNFIELERVETVFNHGVQVQLICRSTNSSH